MIVKIPKQRVNKSNRSNPFKDLVNYGINTMEKAKTFNHEFENIINYETATVNKNQEPKCVAARIHGITKIENASAEMAAAGSGGRPSGR